MICGGGGHVVIGSGGESRGAGLESASGGAETFLWRRGREMDRGEMTAIKSYLGDLRVSRSLYCKVSQVKERDRATQGRKGTCAVMSSSLFVDYPICRAVRQTPADMMQRHNLREDRPPEDPYETHVMNRVHRWSVFEEACVMCSIPR